MMLSPDARTIRRYRTSSASIGSMTNAMLMWVTMQLCSLSGVIIAYDMLFQCKEYVPPMLVRMVVPLVWFALQLVRWFLFLTGSTSGRVLWRFMQPHGSTQYKLKTRLLKYKIIMWFNLVTVCVLLVYDGYAVYAVLAHHAESVFCEGIHASGHLLLVGSLTTFLLFQYLELRAFHECVQWEHVLIRREHAMSTSTSRSEENADV